MKKIYYFILVVLIAVCIAACNNDITDTESNATESEFESASSATESYASEESISFDESSVPEDSAEESLSDEVLEEATDENPEDVSEEVSKEMSEEVSEELSEEVSEEVAEEVTEEAAEEANKALHRPTELEAEALYWINVNRAEHGLHPLEFNSENYECARIRAEESTVVWGHTRPNGEGFRTVYDEQGIDWTKHWTGENLASRYSDAKEVTNALMNSEGHRKNLLCPHYTSVALCVIQLDSGKYHMVQLFWG